MDAIDRKHQENLQRMSDQRAEALDRAWQKNTALQQEIDQLKAQLSACQSDSKDAAISRIRALEPDPRGHSYYASSDYIHGYEAGFESAKDAAMQALSTPAQEP